MSEPHDQLVAAVAAIYAEGLYEYVQALSDEQVWDGCDVLNQMFDAFMREQWARRQAAHLEATGEPWNVTR